MAIYKCKNCSHEHNQSYKPDECEICGHHEFAVTGTTGRTALTIRGKTMAIDKDIFSSYNFRTTIQNYCDKLDWNISDINNDGAVIKFEMDSGSTQTVFIIKYENTLEFSCPSGIKFGSRDDIPHILSTILLEKNSEYKLGFWCIEKIGEKLVFSVMHNSELTLIDLDYFRKIVVRLVTECDDFELMIEKMMR
jgi:hypothetical protein